VSKEQGLRAHFAAEAERNAAAAQRGSAPSTVTVADRRAHRRLECEESQVQLRARLNGEDVTADVLDISECGITIALERAARRAPAHGEPFPDSQLFMQNGDALPLGRLTVQRHATFKRWGTLTLVTDDRETQAVLWRVMMELSPEGELNNRPEADAVPHHLPRVPRRAHYTEEARVQRLEWLREQTRVPLAPLQHTRLSADRLTGNLENFVGAVEVPVGIAGPLVIHGRQAQGLFYAPMATTEGALVASVTRGAFALSHSGGVTTRVIKQQMMRVPLFVLSSLKGTLIFASWVRDHVEELRKQVSLVSRHARLMSVEPVIIGNMVHLRFLYETGDAAGQNMTTACTWQACQWLMNEMKYFDEVEFENFLIEGNMSGDKKVNFHSLISGRGIRVVAEGLVRTDVLRRVFGITPEQAAFLHTGAMAGSIQNGTVGYNINVANVIAAIFTATGQDIACVHESSLGLYNMQRVEDGIYVSMVLPCLVIGTVGGGTHLPAQNALLDMMGCAGRGKVARLAEVIAAFCLALDLSTGFAVAAGDFATAHDRLGRNRPVQWLSKDDLTREFFEPALRTALGQPTLELESIAPVKFNMGSSIIAELTARKLKKLVGLFPLRLRYTCENDEGKRESAFTDVFVKVKPLDEEAMVIMDGMALMCGARLSAAWRKHRHRTQFSGCHVRELGVCEQTDPRFTDHAPAVYHTFRDDKREAYVIVLEKLTDMVLMDSVDEAADWRQPHVEAALRGIAAVHSMWLGREDELKAQSWLGPYPNAVDMAAMGELFEALALHAAEELPNLVTPELLEHQRMLIRTVPTWYAELEVLPRTLIHNDFNPRNIAFRRRDGELRLCAYDWELATMQVPQHDLAEFLCFVLTPDAPRAEVDRYIDYHRRALEQASGRPLDAAEWRKGYRLSLDDILINRFAFYLVGHTFRHYAFMERAWRTLCHLIDLEAAGTP
jgi:NADP-dependent 3-hydroxy-3-methylglutaryl-CoA reductase